MNDKAAVNSFDDIEVRRHDVAISYLKLLGILAKSSAGATVIEDRLLSGYLAGLQLGQLE